MSYQPTYKFLDQLADAEQCLREIQKDLRNNHPDLQIRLIADHFQRTESLITDIIAEMRENLDEETLRAFHQIEPAFSPRDIFKESPQSDNVKDWVNWSLKCQQKLAEWCKHLAEKSTSKKAADLFGRLTERIETLNRQLATDTRSLVQK